MGWGIRMENSAEERLLRIILRKIDAHYARLRDQPKGETPDMVEQVFLPMLERVRKLEQDLRSGSSDQHAAESGRID